MPLLSVIFETAQGILTDTMALAAVALIGYLFGHRTRRPPTEIADEKLGIEISRAALIAKELQQVAQHIRQEVSSHQTRITKFKTRIGGLQQDETAQGWQLLSDEAESLLAPTMKLATKLSFAYDQLRKQSTQLMNFADTRLDPQTGVCNRRAMEEQLDELCSMHAQNNSRFSLALFSMRVQEDDSLQPEHLKDQLRSDQFRQFAKLLESCSRDTDLVARCSSEEFIVLMPHTSLAGATVYSERLLQRIDAELGEIISGGIVEVKTDDTPKKILSRADSALYSARTNKHSCLYLHNGKSIRPHEVLHRAVQTDIRTPVDDSYQSASETEPVLVGNEA